MNLVQKFMTSPRERDRARILTCGGRCFTVDKRNAIGSDTTLDQHASEREAYWTAACDGNIDRACIDRLHRFINLASPLLSR
jgi:hypothetical protein